MTKTIPCPPAFFGSGITQVVRAGRGVYHAACPKCGGVDRVFLLEKSRATGEPLAVCRYKGMSCDWTWWPGKNGDQGTRLSDEELAIYAARRAVDEQTEAEKLRTRLFDFRAKHVWETYHQNLINDDGARGFWGDLGIDSEWRGYWKLGWLAEKQYLDGEGASCTCPAHTIPKFAFLEAGETVPLCRNVDYRLTVEVAGRYRPVAGLPATYFVSHPGMSLAKPTTPLLILTEGSKKAMVVSRYLSRFMQREILVVGYPSQNSWGGVEQLAAHFEKKIILPDPDAIRSGWGDALAVACGAGTRIAELPEKCDDLLTKYGVPVSTLVDLMRAAREPRIRV